MNTTSTRLSQKQSAAVAYVAQNPGADVDAMIDAVGVKGHDDNRAAFLLRLLRTGAVRLEVADERLVG